MSEQDKINEEAKRLAGNKSLEEMRNRHAKFNKTKWDNKPASPETVAYFQKLEDQKAADKDFSISALMNDLNKIGQRKINFVPYPISFEDAEKVFYKIMEQKLSVNDARLIVEPVNKPKVDELIRYFIGQPNKLSLSKGIYLYGPVGRGKTVIMDSFRTFCQLFEKKLDLSEQQYTSRRFTMQNTKSIVIELAAKNKPETLTKYYGSIYCFDDLGQEEAYKLFGNNIDVMSDIIIERYQKYQSGGLITHATSNIMSESWKEKYGDRVDSRLNEMFNIIRLEGVDKRK